MLNANHIGAFSTTYQFTFMFKCRVRHDIKQMQQATFVGTTIMMFCRLALSMNLSSQRPYIYRTMKHWYGRFRLEALATRDRYPPPASFIVPFNFDPFPIVQNQGRKYFFWEFIHLLSNSSRVLNQVRNYALKRFFIPHSTVPSLQPIL